MKHFIIFCLAVICLSSCEKNLVEPYQGPNMIYFPHRYLASNDFNSPYITSDSLLISFGLTPNRKDTLVDVPVRVTGDIVNYDRKYKLKIMESSTAQKGVDYKLAKKNDFTIDAGEYEGKIYIHLVNTTNIQDTSLYIKLKLLPNKYFKTKLIGSNISNQKRKSNIFKVYLTGIPHAPNGWSDIWFGTFSLKKYLLMEKVLNIDFGNSMYVLFENGGIYVAVHKMVRYFKRQAAAGNTIYAPDGKPMKMGPLAY